MDSEEKQREEQKEEKNSSKNYSAEPDGDFNKISDLFKTVNNTGGQLSDAPQRASAIPIKERVPETSRGMSGSVETRGVQPPAPSIPRKEDILLDTHGEGQTAVKDPLFAARILEQEQESLVRPPTILPKISRITPVAPSEGEEEGGTEVKTIRTYQSDVAEALKKQKTSVIQMVLAEHKRKETNTEELSPTSKKNLPVILVSALFIALSVMLIGGGGFYFLSKNKSAENPTQEAMVPSPVFAEAKKGIDITGLSRDRIIDEVNKEMSASNLRLDSVLNIYFAERIDPSLLLSPTNTLRLVSTERFFSALESKMPNALSRSLESQFMLGVHAFNGNEAFLILKTNFFENAFAGMLKWEEFMARELLPLFASPAGKEVYDRNFQDFVLKNRDLRVLYNGTGEIVLLYSFYDNNTIVVSTSPDTLDEVTSRLSRPKESGF
ncbi:MAG: hypothetical protein NUV42_01560 [Candidatus Yonathbacteria bacterium]|nr:hypothetical protein [Candidatus Yonathbacteria bacterium]